MNKKVSSAPNGKWRPENVNTFEIVERVLPGGALVYDVTLSRAERGGPYFGIQIDPFHTIAPSKTLAVEVDGVCETLTKQDTLDLVIREWEEGGIFLYQVHQSLRQRPDGRFSARLYLTVRAENKVLQPLILIGSEQRSGQVSLTLKSVSVSVV